MREKKEGRESDNTEERRKDREEGEERKTHTVL